MSEDALIAFAYESHVQGDLQSAKKYYEEFLKLSPYNPQAYNNLAVIYFSQKEYVKAKILYEKALTCKPDYLDALKNIASLCKLQNDLTNAKRYYEQVLSLEPNNINALNTLTVLSKKENNLIKAKEYALIVLRLDPNNVDALNNMGVIAKEQRDLITAKNYYDRVIELDPNSLETLLNLSLLYLLQKDYIKGFDLYRNRYRKYDLYTNENLVKHKKLINSFDELMGKKVLVCFEQGFGDAVQFIRLALVLKNLNAEFSYLVPHELLKLFRQSFPEVSFVMEDEIESFEYYFPILDACYLTGLEYETIPFREKYLHVNVNDVESFKKTELAKTSKKRIGFAYQGSVLHHNDTNRSITLEMFLQGISSLHQDYEFYALQYGISVQEQQLLKKYGVADLGSKIENFYDSAIMVESMDAIISIDSSLLHVSGALGKKAYLLLPFAPDWRWGIEDKETNWYDCVKIYRQDAPGDWSKPFLDLARDVINEL